VNNRVFTIWCNHDFAGALAPERELLIQDAGNHQLQLFDPKDDGKDGESRQALASVDIAFGYPDAQSVRECENLRWVHLHFAGYTAFDNADLKQTLTKRGTVLTNSSAVYDEPCAQHLLAMIMALARGLRDGLQAAFVVNHDGRYRAYVNNCPHVGTPLDLWPNEFFSEDGRTLICSTHGAVYEPTSGLCTAGPCVGDRLTALPLAVEGETLVVRLPAAAVSPAPARDE